jgi:plasmid maintenance system antidote protein VapI
MITPTVKRPRGRPKGRIKCTEPRRRRARPTIGLFPGVCRTALAAKIGMHRVSVTRILMGRMGCSSGSLEKLAAALGTQKSALSQMLAGIRSNTPPSIIR